MNCLKCGVELKEGAKFCKICGAPQPIGPRKCVKCGAELDADAKFCDECGAPQQPGTVAPPVTVTPPVAQVPPPEMPQAAPPPVRRVITPPPGLPPKKLVTYRLLSLFLGGLGIHSFYAGYTNKAIIQLALCWTGISGIWALFDVFKVTTDAYGRPMADTVPKSRTTYRLLALFCGGIGAHNFYSGHLGRGLAKILLCWTGISWLWALVEMFAVEKDANGNPMVVGEKAEKICSRFAGLSIVFAAVGLLSSMLPMHSLRVPVVLEIFISFAGVVCLVLGVVVSFRKSDVEFFILISLGLVLLAVQFCWSYGTAIMGLLSVLCGLVALGFSPRKDGDFFAMLSMGFALPTLVSCYYYFNNWLLIMTLLGIVCSAAALSLRPRKGGGAVVISLLGAALLMCVLLAFFWALFFLPNISKVLCDIYGPDDGVLFWVILRVYALSGGVLSVVGIACGVAAVRRRRWLGIAGIMMSLGYLVAVCRWFVIS